MMNATIQWNERSLAPTKIICVGRNYVEHIHELDNPMPDEIVLFLKPNSALTDTLRCPAERCRYEAEITLLFEDQQVVAVGVGLDLTLVDVQQRLKHKSLPWEKSKAFDGSALFSPFVDAPQSLDGLWLRLSINDRLRQEGGVSLMMHKPHALLAEAQRHFSLCDGDLLMTGTPKGVGELLPGDAFHLQLFDGEQLLVQQRWQVE